jgi:excinuclease ABC subunit A
MDSIQNQNQRFLKLKGVRVNNLKNIDVNIPLKKFTIVTGVSGSGKSSLVFDTLYAEGQRRYVESLSTYSRQFLEKLPKPDIDTIENIQPSLALEQKNHINNSKTTVASMSDLYDYFKLLWAKIGHTYCYQCEKEILEHQPTTIAKALKDLNKKNSNQAARFYVLSPIDNKDFAKKTWIETKKKLIQKGFTKIFTSNHEVLDIESTDSFSKNTEKIFLVIDRMSLSDEPTKDPRLIEAIETAYKEGNGKVCFAFVNSSENNNSFTFYFFSNQYRCDDCNIDYKKPEPQLFSFDSPIGACPDCSGFGFNLELDENLVVPNPKKSIKEGAIDPLNKPASKEWFLELLNFCEKHKINVNKPYEKLSQKEKDLIWNGDLKTKKNNGFQGIRGCFEELSQYKYKLHVRVFIRRYQTQKICLSCNGQRLKKTALSVKIGNHDSNKKNIAEILSLPIEEALNYFKNFQENLPQFERELTQDILKQIIDRLKFMNDVGVNYLTLNRLAKTLSGGETQRINLATQLGNKLCSTLYVLDEPSIGLHPSDTTKLLKLLQELRDNGNTLVVVEHDLQVIKNADYLIEIGPKAGKFGGEIIVQAPLKEALNSNDSLTIKYLKGDLFLPKRNTRRPHTGKSIKIEGACAHNLKNISVEFPLYQLIAVTGVSGSGKTTLIHHTLYNALERVFKNTQTEVGKFYRIYGITQISDCVLLDQSPIGRSARSNPATYLNIWEDIRKIYANQSLSIRRGYTPHFFSFNVEGGRCPVCKGEGEVAIDMHFMADLKIPCDACDGKKFKKNILDVQFKKKNIYELLKTTVDECIDLFREYPQINSKLQILKKVGLGYLELGQSSTTMSGGESQRLKIAKVLCEQTKSNTLFIFDEPTTGLHIDDVKKLIQVMHDLVDDKNTVIVIEHNLELISHADTVIDLGPQGGEKGGQIVAIGTPEEIANNPNSLTGQYLKALL